VRRTNNYAHFARGIEFDGSHFLSTDHDLHRRRRKPLDVFFSRLGVTKLEPMVFEVATRLAQRLQSYKGTNEVVRLDHAYVALAGDIIGRICCENHSDLVLEDDFGVEWYNVLHDFILSIPLVMGFPQIISIARLIPDCVIRWLDPRLKTFDKFQSLAKQQIMDAKSDNEKSGSRDISMSSKSTSIFRHILQSDLPESDRSVDRLSREAQVLLGAGTVTSARTMDFLTFYVLHNETWRKRLQEELATVMRNPETVPSWAELEKLSFMQALLKEALRLSYGVMHRLPRVSPDRPIQYGDYVIPAGVSCLGKPSSTKY
jgi:cytochrome P450